MTRSVCASLIALLVPCAILVPATGRDWRGERTRPASRPASRPAVYPFPPAAKRPTPSTSPAGEVCRAALDWLERAEPVVDRLVPLAGQVADRLVLAGVRGLLNLALTRVVVPRRVRLVDSRFVSSLLVLSASLGRRATKRRKDTA